MKVCSWLPPPPPSPSPQYNTVQPALCPQAHNDSQRQVRREDIKTQRTSQDICFSLNVLCFPFQIGKVKITIFHLLVACTFVFTYLWGYIIYNTIIKNDQVSRLSSKIKLTWHIKIEFHLGPDISFTWTLHATLDRRLILCHFQVDTKLIAAAKPVPTVHDGEILKQQFLT